MKLSKQFMQTNLKWGYLYWQPISLNHPQQGTDGQCAGIACKENRRGRGIRSCLLPPPPHPRLPSFVTITGLFLFMSLIPLLFYVLVKPTRRFTRQVCSKTICQPSLVTRSLAFDTEFGVLFWLSLLERGRAGRRNSPPADAELEIGKTFKTNIWRVLFICLFFTCVSTGHLPLCVRMSPYTGRQILDSNLSFSSCVDITQFV